MKVMNEGRMDARRLPTTMGMSDSGSVRRWRSRLLSRRHTQGRPPLLPSSSSSSASVVPAVVALAVVLVLCVFCCFCSCASRSPPSSGSLSPPAGVFQFDDSMLSEAAMGVGHKVTWVVFAPFAFNGEGPEGSKPFTLELKSLLGAEMTFVGCNSPEFGPVTRECLSEVRTVIEFAQQGSHVKGVLEVPGKLVSWGAKRLQEWKLPGINFVFNSCQQPPNKLYDDKDARCKGGRPVMFDPAREESKDSSMRYYEVAQPGFTTKAKHFTEHRGVKEGPTYTCLAGAAINLIEGLHYQCDMGMYKGGVPSLMFCETGGFRLTRVSTGNGGGGGSFLETKTVVVTPHDPRKASAMEYPCDESGPLRHQFQEYNTLRFTHFAVMIKSPYMVLPRQFATTVYKIELREDKEQREPINRWLHQRNYVCYSCDTSRLRQCIQQLDPKPKLNDGNAELFIVGESAVAMAQAVSELEREKIASWNSSIKYLLKRPRQRQASLRRQQSSRRGSGRSAGERDHAALTHRIWQQYGTEPSTSVAVFGSYPEAKQAGFYKVGDDHCLGSLIVKYDLEEWSCFRGDGETATEPCWQVSKTRQRGLKRRLVNMTITMDGLVVIENSEATGQPVTWSLRLLSSPSYHFFAKSSRQGSGSGTASSSASHSPTGAAAAMTPPIPPRRSVSSDSPVEPQKKTGYSLPVAIGESSFQTGLTHRDPVTPPSSFGAAQLTSLLSSAATPPISSSFQERPTRRHRSSDGNGSRPPSSEGHSPIGSFSRSVSSGEPSPGESPEERWRRPWESRDSRLSREDSEEEASTSLSESFVKRLSRSLRRSWSTPFSEREPITFLCGKVVVKEVTESPVVITRSSVEFRLTDVSLLPYTRQNFAASPEAHS